MNQATTRDRKTITIAPRTQKITYLNKDGSTGLVYEYKTSVGGTKRWARLGGNELNDDEARQRAYKYDQLIRQKREDEIPWVTEVLQGNDPDRILTRGSKIALPEPAFISEDAVVLNSRKDNTFCFGAAGDLHAASKYTRWDVREKLYEYFKERDAQCNFDTGNWIDGESRFNTYDIEERGFDGQVGILANNHPRGLKTYAIWGDDHEGWYAQREGLNAGEHAETIMRRAGHDWNNLGFMEAHVILRNVNSGKKAVMSVVHPGGGSAYAISYSVQKIIESLEGGEKPAVALYGHYHKLWAGLIRNIWAMQTGCQQDQTPFMRKKRLEAHVGGVLVTLRQDPKDGAIVSCQPEMIRYFNAPYYFGNTRWSKHGPVSKVRRA